MTVPTKHASDPELAAAVAGLPELDFSDVAAARAHLTAMLAQLPAPDTTGLTITDRTVPGPEGAPDVAVRIYRPDSQTAPIGILAVHAGGFMQPRSIASQQHGDGSRRRRRARLSRLPAGPGKPLPRRP
jgi:acetyl esterase/lipase